MKLYIFSVMDRCSMVYMRPAFVRAPGEASRMFIDEVNRPAEGNSIWEHPEDFELHALGMFDDVTGRFDSAEPEVVLRGAEVRRRDVQE